MKAYLRKNANLPNALTLLRVLLIPVYVWLFTGGHRYTALGVFAAACLTDLLDGYLARRNHQVTSFGKLMDPLADKLMVITVMFSMVFTGAAPWPAITILIGKECIMVLGGFVMLRHGLVVYSSMIGKVAHCLFIAALILMFFRDQFLAALPGWPATPDRIVLWAAVICTLAALVYYAIWAVRRAREANAIGFDKILSFREVARQFTDDADAPAAQPADEATPADDTNKTEA